MAKSASQSERRADEDASHPETDDELIARYIVRNPDGMGPDEAQTIWGVSVWALIGYMRGEGNTIERTAEAYGRRAGGARLLPAEP